MNQVLKQALALNPQERYYMAMQLLASLESVLDDAITPEEIVELGRRIELLESGADKGISGKEFLEILRKRAV